METIRHTGVSRAWWVGVVAVLTLVPVVAQMDRRIAAALTPDALPWFVDIMGWVTWLGYGAVDIGIPIVIAGHAAREGRKYRVLWTSEPFHELALMASSRVPEADRKAVAAAFIGMGADPRGREILQAAARAVGIPENAYFIASDGREYAPYRRFYETAPAQLR